MSQILQEVCIDCKKPFDDLDHYDTVCGGQLCEDCYYANDQWHGCEDCNRLMNEESLSFNGLCESCYEDAHFVCDGCEEHLWRNDMMYDALERGLCDGCFGQKYGQCADCAEYAKKDDMISGDEYWSNDAYCGDCWARLFEHCRSCGDTKKQHEFCCESGA